MQKQHRTMKNWNPNKQYTEFLCIYSPLQQLHSPPEHIVSRDPPILFHIGLQAAAGHSCVHEHLY